MDQTRAQILDAAEQLAQLRGFNAFSYRDIAEQVGIRGPSIHYHFPSKDDLGVALVERYRDQFAQACTHIDRKARSVSDRLRRFAAVFRATLERGNRMCLCGMLAAELSTLSEPIQLGVQGFWSDCERWLASALEDGRETGELSFRGDSARRAAVVLAGLEGAMLAARVADDPGKFDRIARTLLDELTA